MTQSAPSLQDTGTVLGLAACLLHANGQTSQGLIREVAAAGRALGYVVTVLPAWSEMVFTIESRADASVRMERVLHAAPAAVDMNKVMHTLGVLQGLGSGQLDLAGARAALERVAHLPPASTARFALLAAAGAAALAVIFGNTHVPSLALVAFSAGFGALLRRAVAVRGGNPLLQTLVAAALAGLVGAAAVRFVPGVDAYLVALCPCMVLMPGPHLLNGALDLAHMRMVPGQARLGYATLLTLLICVGLIAGLAVGGQQVLPPPGPATPVPLLFDVLAAGVAVAAYATFFSMSWGTIPIAMVIGMFAHACRWVALTQGAGPAMGALIACLIVGLLVTPITNRLRLPFAAFAFASVVSLIPGVYLFRMAAALVAVMRAGPGGDVQLLMAPFVDGTTAATILLAMAFGLVLPKLLLDRLAGLQ